jgi:hypothetical protein
MATSSGIVGEEARLKERRSTLAVSGLALILMVGLGFILGKTYNPAPTVLIANVVLYLGAACLQTAIAYVLATRRLIPEPEPRFVVAAAFVISLVLALTTVSIWPNSGDEYGYIYMAETFLHGRLWNAVSPIPELFDFFWIFDKDGIRISQYAPGWPLILAPFVAVGLQALASPLALVAFGAILVEGFKRLAVPTKGIGALLVLVLLTPFALFNGASLFPMMTAAALVLGVCVLQLRDDETSTFGRRAVIGFWFSVLLATRYEIFALTLACFVIERVWRRRLRFSADAVAYVAGALPLTAMFFAYNAVITGNPLQTTISWLRPDYGIGLNAMGDTYRHTLTMAVLNERTWLGLLCQYGGLALLILYAVAFGLKVRARKLRFFDFLPLTAFSFFFFFPEIGGHQFGPRYWLFAIGPTALTAASLPIDPGGWLALEGRRVHLATFAAWHLAGFAVMIAVVAIDFRYYVDERREVLTTLPPVTPSVILIPSRELTTHQWQSRPDLALSMDFTRNGTDFSGPILYGRADVPRAAELACGMRKRAVFIWRNAGDLQRIDCDQLLAPAPVPAK